MNDIERLLAIEGIRTAMARRARCLDEKDWTGFADCYTADAVSYSLKSAPGGKVVGAQAIAAGVAGALNGVVTAHQLHLPEITIVSDDTAETICPLNDILSWEKDGKRFWMRAYGHYRQTYKRVGGAWRISEHHLTRLLVEHGNEVPTPLGQVGPGRD